MTDLIVQRGSGDKPGDDISDPLLTTIAAALSRGRAELDEGTLADQAQIERTWHDHRLGDTVSLRDPIAGRWRGKVTGVQHTIEIDSEGNVSGRTDLTVRVPRL